MMSGHFKIRWITLKRVFLVCLFLAVFFKLGQMVAGFNFSEVSNKAFYVVTFFLVGFVLMGIGSASYYIRVGAIFTWSRYFNSSYDKPNAIETWLWIFGIGISLI